MRTGTLRHRVEIQRRVTSQDSYGSPSETWELVDIVWASIEPLIGREMFAAQAVQTETTGKIRMRFRSDITTAHRGVYGGKVFNFLAVVNPDTRNRELVIYTSEGLNNG